MTTKPVTVDADDPFGNGLIYVHQGRTALVMTPEQADRLARDLARAYDAATTNPKEPR